MLEEELKAYYRKLADYESAVVPVYCKLVNVDWAVVRRQFDKRRHELFRRSCYIYWKQYQGAYRGPKIRRWEVLPGTKYALKLCLPILTPAELDSKRIDKAAKLYNEVFANMNARREEGAADYREYLAEQLGT